MRRHANGPFEQLSGIQFELPGGSDCDLTLGCRRVQNAPSLAYCAPLDLAEHSNTTNRVAIVTFDGLVLGTNEDGTGEWGGVAAARSQQQQDADNATYPGHTEIVLPVADVEVRTTESPR